MSSSSSVLSRLQGIFSKTPKHISSNASLAAAAATSTVQQTSLTPQISGPSEIKELVKKFKKNSRSTDFRRRQDRYEYTIRRLAAGKHFSAIETILEHQKKYKESMADEGFCVRLISLYGKAGMFDHAYKVFDEMPQFDCIRTVTSFNALLYACVKSKKLDRISEIFREMPEKLGIEPNVVSYNTVVKAFCDSGDFDSAMKLIDEMEGSEIRPDTASYNTVFEGFYKENKLDEAEKLWERMEGKGVVANVRTYNAKLRFLIRCGQVKEALELVEKMGREEVNPDKFSYNIVIKGCVGSGDLEEAKMLHGKMVGDEECLPNNATYEMLVSFACEKGDIDFAFELCKQAIELKVFIYRTAMQLVVDGLIQNSKIEEANELVALVNSSKKHRYTLTSPVTE